jgi:endogenous inhibitor of DNA gyrase (YacG/DUF329 family)
MNSVIEIDMRIKLICSACGEPVESVNRKWSLADGDPKHTYFVAPCSTCFKFVPPEERSHAA